MALKGCLFATAVQISRYMSSTRYFMWKQPSERIVGKLDIVSS